MRIFRHKQIRAAALALSLSLSLCLAALVGPSVNAHADTGTGQVTHVYMDVPATPSTSTSNGYRVFIESIRSAAGHAYRGNTYIAQRYAGGIIRADLNVPDSTGTARLSLWMDPQNLYVLGFTGLSGQTLYFNDLARSAVERMTRAVRQQGFNGQIAELPYGSNYDSLRGAAGRGREDMSISHRAIWSAVLNLSTTNPQNVGVGDGTRSSARSLSLLIQVLSEAARFNDVFALIQAALGGAPEQSSLPGQMQALENSWAAISRWGTDVTRNGSAPARTIIDAGPVVEGHPTNLVLHHWGDVARYLAMLLGNFNLPTETSGGHWGQTEL